MDCDHHRPHQFEAEYFGCGESLAYRRSTNRALAPHGWRQALDLKILGYTRQNMPILDCWRPLAYPDAGYRE